MSHKTEIENKLKNEKRKKPESRPRESVFIRRKEIIQILGRSSGFVDCFIKKNEDFPKKVSYGCYSRKEVMAWLKDKGLSND